MRVKAGAFRPCRGGPIPVVHNRNERRGYGACGRMRFVVLAVPLPRGRVCERGQVFSFCRSGRSEWRRCVGWTECDVPAEPCPKTDRPAENGSSVLRGTDRNVRPELRSGLLFYRCPRTTMKRRITGRGRASTSSLRAKEARAGRAVLRGGSEGLRLRGCGPESCRRGR